MLALFVGLEEEAKNKKSKTSLDYPTVETKILIQRFASMLGTSNMQLILTLTKNAIISALDKANLSPESYEESLAELNRLIPTKQDLTSHPFLKSVNLEMSKTADIFNSNPTAYSRIKEMNGIFPVGAWRLAVATDNPPDPRAYYIDQLGNFFDRKFAYYDHDLGIWCERIAGGRMELLMKALCTGTLIADDYDNPVYYANGSGNSVLIQLRNGSFDSYKNYIGVPESFKSLYAVDHDAEQRALVAENTVIASEEELLDKIVGRQAEIDLSENVVSGFSKPVTPLSLLV